MEKNQEYYLNKNNYGNICVPSRDDTFTHLIKENFLSEFSTEEDKLQVLENLGLLKKLEYIKLILSNKIDINTLERYVTESQLIRYVLENTSKDGKSRGYYSSLPELVQSNVADTIGDWAIVNLDGDWYIYKYTSEGWKKGELFKTNVDLSEYAKLSDLINLQSLLISGTNIKTINGQSILGEGDIEIKEGNNEGIEIDLSNYATKEDLYNIQYPLTLKLSISPSLAEYTGENQQVTVSFVTKKGETIVVPDQVLIKLNNQDPINVSGTYSTPINRLGVTTFEVTCRYNAEEKTGLVSVNFVNPTYIGFSSAETNESLNILELHKKIISGINTSESLLNVKSGNYLWIVSPYRVNKVATDPGFTYNVKMIAVSNDNGLYYYRSSSAIDISHLTYYIK